MIKTTEKTHLAVLRITVAAMFAALNVAFSSFGVPVPGGHLYLNDVVICTAAVLLDPFSAFFVGGVGAFLGDLFFYPAPMFVSLVTHGLQAVVISLFSRHVLKEHPVIASGLGVSVGAVIMVVGYSLGRAFIYSAGIRRDQTAVSDSSGGSRCRPRYADRLAVRRRRPFPWEGDHPASPRKRRKKRRDKQIIIYKRKPTVAV